MIRKPRTMFNRVRRAFTLMELLVVVGISVIIVALTAPLAHSLITVHGMQTGVNTVSIAVTAIRAYATRDKPNMNPPIVNASYSGTGLIFTQCGEVRMVENDQAATALSPTDFLESKSPTMNGFTDIGDRDYITMPADVGVVGIARADDDGIRLLTPPFGIRFTRHGNLISSTEHDKNREGISRIIFYDGNGDNIMQEQSGAAGGSRQHTFDDELEYNPDIWRPGTPEFDAVRDDSDSNMPGWDTANARWRLPYEQMETCVGVVVFSMSEFRSAGNTFLPEDSGDTASSVNDAAKSWIIARGKAVFFGRYSGTMIKEGRK